MSSRTPSGYSGTPLDQKLGLKDGQRAVFVNLAVFLRWLVGAVHFASALETTAQREIRGADNELIHAFFTEAASLEESLPALMGAIVPNGTIWISWSKRTSKWQTDITEDVIRSKALPLGLVDVKVCAVDEIWSGLKLVIRKELRLGS